MTILPAVLCAFILSASVFAPARAEEITERQSDVTTDRTVDVENTYKNIQANEDGGVFLVRSTLTFNAAATFLNNASEKSGGAIYIAGKEGIAGTVNFNADATFTKNSAGNGGAVFNESALNFNGGTYTFENNAATANVGNGGAIYNAGLINFGTDDKRVSLTFTNNTAMEGGGAIFNTNGGVVTIKGDATFSGDAAAEAVMKYGGAIRNFKGNASGSQFIVDGTAKFDNNKASWGGGALSNDTNSLFSVSGGAMFEGNTAGLYGGAIYNKGTVSFGGLAIFNDNKTGNTTEANGGAVYNYTSSAFEANAGAKFTNNTAGAHGGAVYNGGSFTLKGDATFTDNTANGNGGAFFNNGTISFVNGAKFKNNSAGKQGGAVYNNGTASFGGITRFESNTVSGEEGKGGAVYNGTDGVLTFADDVFFNLNTAENYGGAIRNNGMISFANGAKFENNSAGKHGGAIYNNGTISFDGATRFEGNGVSGEDGKGGAIYNEKDGVLTFTDDVSFVNNTATGERYSDGGAIYNEGTINFGTDDKRVNVTFENNSAKDGGGSIFNRNGGVVTIRGSAIFSSDADAAAVAKYGGAIRNYKDADADGSQFIVDGDATFTNSKALLNGGALSNGEGSLFSVSGNATFENNSAGENGGAISSMGTLVFGKENETSLTQFLGNTAQGGSGGAVFNYTSGTLTFYGDAAFNGNTSGVKGGAIFNAGTIKFNGSAVFTNNKAAHGGAATNKSKLTFVKGATFKNNCASVNGGAIYNVGTFVSDGDLRFEENESGLNGGAVYNASSGNFSVNGNATFIKNKSQDGSALINFGTVTFGKTALFKENFSETSVSDGTVWNKGIINFNGLAEFIDNTAYVTSGAIYNDVNGNVNFNAGATFTSNTTGTSGGAVYNKGRLNFNAGATFTGNSVTASSSKGGAIYNLGTLYFNGGDVRFDGNTSQHDGAAVYNASGGVIHFKSNTVFDGNEGFRGVLFNSGTVNFTGGATFTNNKSAGNGGAIYNDGTISFSDAEYVFENNTVSGKSFDIYNTGTLNIGGTQATVFKAASILGSGMTNITGTGTVDFFASSGSVLTWENYINIASGATLTVNDNFLSTVIKKDGFGDVILNKGTLNFKGATNEFKTAGTGSELNNIRNDSVMNIGVAGNTTAFNVSRIAGTGTTNILGTVNLNAANAEKTIDWQNHIVVDSGVTLTVTGTSKFHDADYSGSGGAFYNNGTVVLNGDVVFENNKTSLYGAAIRNEKPTSVFTINGFATFKKNTAADGNAAISNRGTMTLNGGGLFEGNETKQNGGAAIANSGSLTLDVPAGANVKYTFKNNISAGIGGAINNINGGSFLTFNADAEFTGNTSVSLGGAIYNANAMILNFNGSSYTFANNKAGGVLNDIHNDGVMNVGVAGNTTDFNVSYVTGTGTTNILGTVNLKATNAEKTIDWQNHIDVAGGAALTVNDAADFKNGTAEGGGALNVRQNGKAEFNGVTSFKGNHGNNNGGAILNYGNLVFNNTATFDGNSGITGGGIANGGTLIINAFADFKNNEANTYGGALNNYGGKAYLNASANFENNSVSQRGGSVYNHSTSEITFAGDSYTFKNNKVGGRGFNDIYNDGVMNVGVAGKTTGFNISYISNRQTRNITAQTNFFGTVNLKATNDNDLIDFKNRMVLKSGVTLNVLSDIVVTGYTKDMASSEYGGGISMGGGVFNALGNVTIKDNFVNGQGGGIDMTGGVMTLGSAGKTVRFENNFSYYGGAARLVGGTLNIDGKAEFVGNSTGRGSAVYLEYATLNLNGDALFENNPSSTAAIYNMAGKVNFNASSYEFKNNKVGDSYGDIYNNGNILIGNDKTDTSFTISFVDGSGVTEFRGGKTVEMRAASGNVISFKNNVTVTGGTTLGIGQNLFDMGDKNLTLTSEGTLKLTISDLTAGASDYTGGQFKTAGTATIGGTLFVTIDPSVSLIGETGELTLVDAGTFSGVFADWKISNGYTIRYVGDGKFIIGKSDDPDPNPPAPTPEPPAQDTEFVKPAKEVAISDVRAGVAQIADRLSSLGASMSVSPASPTANQGRSGGDAPAETALWAKALYTSTDLRGATKMDSDGYGFIIGADGGASGDLYLGAALGYTHNKGDTDLSHFKSETYLGYLYGRYALTRKTGLTGTIGYGFTQFDLDAATGKFNAHTINAQATADYALPAHLTAEIGARYTFSAMDAYTTGTTKVAAQDTHTGTVLAGLRYRRNVGGFVVKANAGALYDVYSDAADYRLTQSGAASYARGERLHRFGGEAGAGFGYEGEAFGVEADYNAQVRKDYNDQTVSVKFVYRFNAPKARRKTAAGGKVTAVPATPAQHKVAEPIASPVQNKVDAPVAPAAQVKLANRRIVISTGETVKQKTDAPPATPVQHKVAAASATPVQNKVDAPPAAVPASPTPASHKAAAPATPAQHKVAEPIASPVQHKVVPASPTPVAPPAAAEAEIIEAYCVSMRRALCRYYGIEAE